MTEEEAIEAAYERGESDGAAEEYERLYQKIVNRISADIMGDFDQALDQLVYNTQADERKRWADIISTVIQVCLRRPHDDTQVDEDLEGLLLEVRRHAVGI